MNHICILDIGKTNKKCFVFDEDYQIVYEQSTYLPETTDEDGMPCENLELLTSWVVQALDTVCQHPGLNIKAVNATAYGASLVHLNAAGKPILPLYNYLKPFPEDLLQQFFINHGKSADISLETASPVLGNLNSGLQLYWLKQQKPLAFEEIQYSLHLPQYIAFLFHGQYFNEITSMGCHTLLWHFEKQSFHHWATETGIARKFPPFPNHRAAPAATFMAGTGLHDSSAALLPYLASFSEPFVLISTGTWCISLNPFNQEPLTAAALEQDCLCYLSTDGRMVKAARYFGGHEHDAGVQAIAAEFNVSEDFYKQLNLNSPEAKCYLGLLEKIVSRQVESTRLAIGSSDVRRIFVDGGFSKNPQYMQQLARAFPQMEVFAAEVAQATAIGAALSVHSCWNEKPVPDHLISTQQYHV